MENALSKTKIEYLLDIEKYYLDSQSYKFPSLGGKLSIPLKSSDKNEDFILDITRSHINISKNTFQNRARKTIVLLRLDIDSAPHQNPNGEKLGGTHLHIYKEGYGDKFAYPLPDDFKNCNGISDYLDKFMDYCHIIKKPIIEKELFT